MDYDLDTPSTSSEVLMPAGELILSGQPVFEFAPGDSKGSGVFAARELWIGRKDSRPL